MTKSKREGEGQVPEGQGHEVPDVRLFNEVPSVASTVFDSYMEEFVETVKLVGKYTRQESDRFLIRKLVRVAWLLGSIEGGMLGSGIDSLPVDKHMARALRRSLEVNRDATIRAYLS